MHAGGWAAAHLHQGLCLNVLVIRPLICSLFAASRSACPASASWGYDGVFFHLPRSSVRQKIRGSEQSARKGGVKDLARGSCAFSAWCKADAFAWRARKTGAGSHGPAPSPSWSGAQKAV